MAKAKKLPSGQWRTLVYSHAERVNGKDVRRYESFTADTKRESEYLAAEFAYSKKKKEKPSNLTVGEAMDEYISNRDGILSPSTIKSYKVIRKTYLKSNMGTALTKLSNENIQKEFNQEVKEKELSPKSLRNILGLLSATLKQYSPDFELNIKLPQKNVPKINVPETPDILKIIDASQGTKMYVPILLAAFLGLRRGEVCGLKWDEIDFIKNAITINASMVQNPEGGWELKEPKSYAGNRTLQMPEILSNALKEERRISDFVVPITPNNLYNYFSDLLKKNNIPHFRFHDLRHFNASMMLAMNIPDKYAMERMGHTTNSTLKTVYQHTIQSERESIDISVSNYFDGICNTKCNTDVEKH